VLTGYALPTNGSGHVFYDLAMDVISTLGAATARDLAEHDVVAITVSPGFTRTEAILAAFGDNPLPPGSDTRRTRRPCHHRSVERPRSQRVLGTHRHHRRPRRALRDHRTRGRSGMSTLSSRLGAIVDALPLRAGMRVLEIGGGPGAATKAVARRIGDGHILMIHDRPLRQSIALAERKAADGVADGLVPLVVFEDENG
jgi:hypothetical protein